MQNMVLLKPLLLILSLNQFQVRKNNKKCKGCWAIEGKTWFTKRHHRETPYRIENNQADVGIVWTTEVKHGLAEGRKIEGVAISAPYNMGHKVGYAIGALSTGKNQKNASRFLAYLSTSQAQDIYAKYGFVKATAEDLKLKPIPSKK
jgi:ABC-type molybdate transport system substrate-binding protein